MSASCTLPNTPAAASAGHTYRLVGQLHERRVIQLPNLIFGPVVARSTSIHSSPHRSLGFWRWRWSCRYRGEGVIDGRAERSYASHGSGGGGSQASSWSPLREQTQRHGYRIIDRSVVRGQRVWYGQYNTPYEVLLQRAQQGSQHYCSGPHHWPLSVKRYPARSTRMNAAKRALCRRYLLNHVSTLTTATTSPSSV